MEQPDVDAIAVDIQKVLYDLAAVLERHGHILDAPGENADGA